jgi:hypothetical protein
LSFLLWDLMKKQKCYPSLYQYFRSSFDSDVQVTIFIIRIRAQFAEKFLIKKGR